jgi:hypothetical protein
VLDTVSWATISFEASQHNLTADYYNGEQRRVCPGRMWPACVRACVARAHTGRAAVRARTRLHGRCACVCVCVRPSVRPGRGGCVFVLCCCCCVAPGVDSARAVLCLALPMLTPPPRGAAGGSRPTLQRLVFELDAPLPAAPSATSSSAASTTTSSGSSSGSSTGRCISQQRLMRRTCEFPSANWDRHGQRHAHIYCCADTVDHDVFWGPTQCVAKLTLDNATQVCGRARGVSCVECRVSCVSYGACRVLCVCVCVCVFCVCVCVFCVCVCRVRARLSQWVQWWSRTAGHACACNRRRAHTSRLPTVAGLHTTRARHTIIQRARATGLGGPDAAGRQP